MTEEQKRFKIQKRTSYEEQISKESKEINANTFIAGLSAAVALCGFTKAIIVDNDMITQLLSFGIGITSTSMSACHFRDLIIAISKKTMLQSKVEDINTELETPENEESKGIRR